MSIIADPGTGAPHLWHSDYERSPHQVAALYREAADLIRTSGYDQYDEYEQARGVSIPTALSLVALRNTRDSADASDLTDELETRLAAVLYLLGQAHYRTGIRDLAGTVASWERTCVREYASSKHRSRTQAEAVTLLETAAAMIAALPADSVR